MSILSDFNMCGQRGRTVSNMPQDTSARGRENEAANAEPM